MDAKNPESEEKSGVLRFAAVVSPVCIRPCARSSRLLPADFAAGLQGNWRTSPAVISCRFFVASVRPASVVRDRPKSGATGFFARFSGPFSSIAAVVRSAFESALDR